VGATGKVTCTIGDLAVSDTAIVIFDGYTARISAAGYDSAASNTFKVKTKVTNLLFSYYNLAESSQCERVLESGL
jgi:hypothetical protein